MGGKPAGGSGGGEGEGKERKTPLSYGLRFLLSPIFLWDKIIDGVHKRHYERRRAAFAGPKYTPALHSIKRIILRQEMTLPT